MSEHVETPDDTLRGLLVKLMSTGEDKPPRPPREPISAQLAILTDTARRARLAHGFTQGDPVQLKPLLGPLRMDRRSETAMVYWRGLDMTSLCDRTLAKQHVLDHAGHNPNVDCLVAMIGEAPDQVMFLAVDRLDLEPWGWSRET